MCVPNRLSMTQPLDFLNIVTCFTVNETNWAPSDLNFSHFTKVRRREHVPGEFCGTCPYPSKLQCHLFLNKFLTLSIPTMNKLLSCLFNVRALLLPAISCTVLPEDVDKHDCIHIEDTCKIIEGQDPWAVQAALQEQIRDLNMLSRSKLISALSKGIWTPQQDGGRVWHQLFLKQRIQNWNQEEQCAEGRNMLDTTYEAIPFCALLYFCCRFPRPL